MILAALLAALAVGGGTRTPDPDVWLAIGKSHGKGYDRLHAGWATYPIKQIVAGNWVPAWSGFAVVRGERMAALHRDGTFSEKSGVLPRSGLRAYEWSISPDGLMLGEYDSDYYGEEAVLQVRNVGSGEVVRRFDLRALERALSASSEAGAAGETLAWSPSGKRLAFAHGIGGGVDNGGAAETRVGVLDVGTGRIRDWGVGTPVAWLSEDRLLIDGQGEA